MTTKTILTDEQLIQILKFGNSSITMGRAIEQAVLQSDPIQSMQGMADCMAMVRQEFIEAGVINESVPPMMVANAVLAETQALREDAGRMRAALQRIAAMDSTSYHSLESAKITANAVLEKTE